MNIFNKAYDFWKKYTPVGIAYTALDEAAEFHVYVANDTSIPISVIVSANKDWVFVDLATSILTLVASAGTSAPSGITALKSAKTLYDIYQATRIWRAIGGVASNIWKIFAETGTVIQYKNYECVNKKSKSNPLNYLTPSQWAAVTGKYTGGKDLEILIMREDGISLLIKSNSDESWIATSDAVYRSERGKVWVRLGQGIAWSSPLTPEELETSNDSEDDVWPDPNEWRDGP
jgi:hypothetical protein